MRFEKITIDNFFAVKHAEIDYRERGLVLVLGSNLDTPGWGSSNGACKSYTFCDSLFWCLYGKTILPESIPADDVVNAKTKKNCRVALDFLDDNGTPHRIERYRKDTNHKNSLHLYVNGSIKATGSKSSTQAAINDIVGIPPATFLNTVIFSVNNTNKFTSMTDAEQKAALEKILSLEWISEYKEIVLGKKQDLERDKTFLERDIDNGESSIRDLEDQIEEHEETSNNFQEENDNKIKEISRKLNSINSELENKDIDDQKKSLKELKESKNTFLAKLEKSIEALENKNRKLRSLVVVERSKKEQIVARYDKVLENEGVECPTCLQPVSSDHVDSISQKTEKSLSTISEKHTSLEKKLKEVSNQLETLKKKYKNAKPKFNGKIESLTEEIHRIEELVISKKLLESHISDLTEVEDPWGSIIDGIQDQLEKKLYDLMANSLKLQKTDDDLEVAIFWIEGFSNRGIKSLLLDGIVEYLNKRSNHYASILTNNAIKIQFQTQTTLSSGEKRDKFKIATFNASGATSYAANSTGERQRIDVCVSLSLGDLLSSRHSKEFNIMILDEVFESIDAVGVDCVMDLFAELSKTKESIFLITHKSHLQSQFSNITTVEKKNNIARVIVEK